MANLTKGFRPGIQVDQKDVFQRWLKFNKNIRDRLIGVESGLKRKTKTLGLSIADMVRLIRKQYGNR